MFHLPSQHSKGKETMTTKPVETPEKDVSEQEQGAVAVSSGGAAAQHTLRNIGLIIGREYKNRVTQRSFVITSVILLVIVFLAPFIPTVVLLVQHGTAQTASQTRIVVVNNAGTVAGLSEAALIPYIGSQLNGTTPTSSAPYAVSGQPQTALDSLRNQVKQGKLDILLMLDRSPQGTLQFLYDANADPNNDPNQSTIQTLAQLLTFLDTAHRLGLTSQETKALAAPPDFTAVHTNRVLGNLLFLPM
jgi:ABC-2 type transport system permease protein